MSEIIIKVKPNKDGRGIANLYGKDFDLTELADKDGKGEFKAFGQIYQFEIAKTKSKSQAKREKIVKEADEPTEAELREIEAEGDPLADIPVDFEETK